MRLPKGVTINGKEYVKLLKSLYGLKQASHDWYELQESFILAYDKRFKKSDVDPCVYIIVTDDLIVIIDTHVDDYIVATNSDVWYSAFFKAFGERFEVKDLGVVSHLLQMAIEWAPDGKSLTISQSRNINALAEKHGLVGCKTIQTPMEKGLSLEPSAVCDASLPYRELLGSLLWVARCTRPDIMYAVIYLSRFSACYDSQHFAALKRILRYLVTTIDRGLTYAPKLIGKAEKASRVLVEIKMYTDSDWASDKNDRKSFSGSVVFINDCAVS